MYFPEAGFLQITDKNWRLVIYVLVLVYSHLLEPQVGGLASKEALFAPDHLLCITLKVIN